MKAKWNTTRGHPFSEFPLHSPGGAGRITVNGRPIGEVVAVDTDSGECWFMPKDEDGKPLLTLAGGDVKPLFCKIVGKVEIEWNEPES